MKTKKEKNARKKGLLVQADDLELGQYYAVHSLKKDPSEPLPFAGQAFRLSALNLPFLIGKVVCNTEHPPVTLDVRFLNFLAVSPEYVKAQQPESSNVS
jgi:hypothetical protein